MIGKIKNPFDQFPRFVRTLRVASENLEIRLLCVPNLTLLAALTDHEWVTILRSGDSST
jgi:hypothetical protein